MAQVRKQLLIVDKSDYSAENAELSFWVDFTHREVSENISFGLYIALLDRDEELEKYHKSPEGVFNFTWFNPIQSSGMARWIETKTVQPNGSDSLYFNFHKTLEQNEINTDNGYRAFIFLMPEITCGHAWTNDVCVNYR